MAQHRRVTCTRLVTAAAAGLGAALLLSGCFATGSAAPAETGSAAPAETGAAALTDNASPDSTTTSPQTLPAGPSPSTSAAAASPSAAAMSTASPTPSVSAAPSAPLFPTVAPAPAGAFVLGDSISLSIAPTLSRLGYPVTGRVGQSASTEYLSTHLASDAAQQAPAWVIVLGTNNRGDEADLVQLKDWLRTIRTSRSGSPRQHVYWVTPHRPAEYDGGMSTHTLDALNAALMREDAQRSWFTVLDFASLAAANPDWYALDGARLHPDERGQAALIDLIAGPGAPVADSPASITEIPRPTASPRPGQASDNQDGAGGDPEFGDMEFTNE